MAPKMPPRMRGQIEYFTSPYEQTLFGDLMNPKLLLTYVRRSMSGLKDMAPAALIFAGVYTWGNAKHAENALEHRY